MTTGAIPENFSLNIPVPEFAKPYFACPSTGQQCPNCRFDLRAAPHHVSLNFTNQSQIPA